MQLGKIVSIACLTYIIYGITSAFQLGTFLPPIPLKPFLFLFFVLTGFIFAVRSKATVISFLLVVWILLYALNSHAFLEVSLNFESLLFYEEHLSLYTSLLMVLVFLIYNLLLLRGILKMEKHYGLLFIPLLTMLIIHFVESTLFPFSYVIMGTALLSYALDRNLEEQRSQLFQLNSILYGVAVIELVEMISLHV